MARVNALPAKEHQPSTTTTKAGGIANMFAELGKAWAQMQTLRYATKSIHIHTHIPTIPSWQVCHGHYSVCIIDVCACVCVSVCVYNTLTRVSTAAGSS